MFFKKRVLYIFNFSKVNIYFRICVTLLIGAGLTIAANKIIEKGLNNYKKHSYGRLEEIFVKNTKFDILFIGSSRTHTTIHPGIIDSITGLSTYNAGMEGAAISEFKMIFDGYLLHHPPPKILILTIDQNSLRLTHDLFDQAQYFPFLNKNKFIKKEFDNMGGNTTLLNYFPFLELIYMDDYVKNNAVKGLLHKTDIKNGEFEYKGFLSNGIKCIDSITNKKNILAAITSSVYAEALNSFNAIIYTCKQRHIKLIITYAPQYRNCDGKMTVSFKRFIDIMDSTTSVNSLQFYRDDCLPLNNNACYFANRGHTNTQGAIAYSGILGKRIKEMLLSQK